MMEEIMKYLISALIFLMPLTSLAMESNDLHLIKLGEGGFNLKNIEKIKKTYIAKNPAPKIREIAEEALKACGIKRNIVLLQRNGGDNSYTICYPNDDQVYLTIGVKDQTLDQITGSIYHEIGHIANNHTTSTFNKWYANILSLSLWPIVGYFLWSSFNLKKPLKYSFPIMFGTATLKSIPCALFLSALINYHNRNHERAADRFGYKKLIENNKIVVALGEIADYILEHENTKTPTFANKIFDAHPVNLERARIGIEELQKLGVNIVDQINNFPNQKLKEYLSEKLPKYFPKLFQAKK
jgi:Zn-dependent protease with chaperone function